MQVLCKPLKCLSFLGGRKEATEYRPVDAQPAKVGSGNVEEVDDDDFFGDSWGGSGESSSSKEAEAVSKGVNRNPTRETTTKRATGSSGATGTAPPAAAVPKAAGGAKKDTDFFGDLGMEPEYKAPRTRTSAGGETGAGSASKGRSVSALLEEKDAGAAEAGGGWGDEDLDLGL
eukprot:TRINITY_DN5991_c0_g1_i2.p3 TRINITY_DN5991_c0_g1~~TRINITY_DN5991_c0_g1_i2.p3  ORF type:complete len:174 (+),score=54.20 TRINITY_DN5991_c0_g1_i2:136-657(+)